MKRALIVPSVVTTDVTAEATKMLIILDGTPYTVFYFLTNERGAV